MASGSELRRRTATFTVRVTPEERDAIDALAMQKGLTVGAFLRAAALGNSGPRAKTRIPVDEALLRQLLGQIGKVGGNLNQIAKRLNTGGAATASEVRAALVAQEEVRQAVLKALRTPTR